MGTRTAIGKFIHNSWTAMNMRAGKYKSYNTTKKCHTYSNIQIEFTQEEYRDFCLQYKDHILSLERPSVDRIDNTLNYTLDNIQFIELRLNIGKEKTIFKNNRGVCPMCNVEKDEVEFVKDKRRLNGRGSICKKCDSNRKKLTALEIIPCVP